jgi:hypothetical protein
MKKLLTILSVILLVPGCSQEKRDWQTIRESGSYSDYSEFLEKYPDGIYSDSARSVIRSRQMVIYSIPDSLEIYFKRLEPDDLHNSGGYIKIYMGFDEHELFNPENKIGKTPVVINDLDSGKYLAGITPVEFHDADLNWQCEDPFLRAVGYVSSIPGLYDDIYGIQRKLKAGEIKQEGAIMYSIEKAENEHKTVVILAQEPITLEEYDKYFPRDRNFQFNAEKLTEELGDKNQSYFLSDEELKKAVDLLQRGGKLIIDQANLRLTAEIKDSTNWEIGTYREQL